jgi:hypothetical protein
VTDDQLRAYAEFADDLECYSRTGARAIRKMAREIERLRAEAAPATDERLREIAELADHLAAERARINAPASPADGGPTLAELCAWARRGEVYLATIRAKPPEDVYRELLEEVERLKGTAAGTGPDAEGGGS